MTEAFEIILKLLVGLTVLSSLILVHEFGHFIIAKLCNVGVVKFAIGFGPPIFKKTYGGTIYQVGPIPLGGYVRMVGDIPDQITGHELTDEAVRYRQEILEEELASFPPETQQMYRDKSCWFVEKGFWPKFWIVLAGPLFNLFFAVAVVGLSLFAFGREVPLEKPIIGTVQENSPAATAGLLKGDQVLSLNGKNVATWDELAKTIREGTGDTATLTVLREGIAIKSLVSPKKKTFKNFSGGEESVYLIGIEPQFEKQSVSLLSAAQLSLRWTYNTSIRTYQGLWGIVSGQVSPKELGGPIFIFGEAGRQAKKGIEDIFYFTAVLSVSLAILNLLPIPILDGGHLMFFIFEALFGPISIRKKEIAQTVGLVLLGTLMVFSLTNDITREPIKEKPAVVWEP